MVQLATRPRAGRAVKIFGFTYRDLADFLGITEAAVRRAVHEGRLDPRRLQSIAAYRERRQRRDTASNPGPAPSTGAR